MMKDTFRTITHKGISIYACNDRATNSQEVTAYVGQRKLEGKSVENMKRRVAKELERQKDFIDKDDFIKIKNDINGNPRYYLPQGATTEEQARDCGGVKYRGKQYLSGWIFCTYNLNGLIKKINNDEQK